MAARSFLRIISQRWGFGPNWRSDLRRQSVGLASGILKGMAPLKAARGANPNAAFIFVAVAQVTENFPSSPAICRVGRNDAAGGHASGAALAFLGWYFEQLLWIADVPIGVFG